jgi:hypothetical protein
LLTGLPIGKQLAPFSVTSAASAGMAVTHRAAAIAEANTV